MIVRIRNTTFVSVVNTVEDVNAFVLDYAKRIKTSSIGLHSSIVFETGVDIGFVKEIIAYEQVLKDSLQNMLSAVTVRPITNRKGADYEIDIKSPKVSRAKRIRFSIDSKKEDMDNIHLDIAIMFCDPLFMGVEAKKIAKSMLSKRLFSFFCKYILEEAL